MRNQLSSTILLIFIMEPPSPKRPRTMDQSSSMNENNHNNVRNDSPESHNNRSGFSEDRYSSRNTRKRPRPNYSTTTSVVKVSNLPFGVKEDRVKALCHAFGRVVDYLSLDVHRSAFIQMESSKAAADLIHHYSQSPPMLDKHHLYFSHTKYDEITKSDENDQTQNRYSFNIAHFF